MTVAPWLQIPECCTIGVIPSRGASCSIAEPLPFCCAMGATVLSTLLVSAQTRLPPDGHSIASLALAAMGVDIFDNLDFERAVEHARQLNRYEFLFSAAPLRIALGTGSPLNPLAIF